MTDQFLDYILNMKRSVPKYGYLSEAIKAGYLYCHCDIINELMKTSHSNMIYDPDELFEADEDNTEILKTIQNMQFDTTGDLHHDYPIFMSSINKSRHPEALTTYSEDEYAKKGVKLYKIRGFDAGFGIAKDGDIISVHNNTKFRDVAPSLIIIAKKLGGKKLDHFNIQRLNDVYQNAGFNEESRLKWDDRYAPKNWDYEKNGRPDVVMRRIPDQENQEPNKSAQ